MDANQNRIVAELAAKNQIDTIEFKPNKEYTFGTIIFPLSDEEILKSNGWEIECESPLEIRHADSSFATGQAAKLILQTIKRNDRI